MAPPSPLWFLPGLATLLAISVSIALIVVAITKVRPVHKRAGTLMAGGAAMALLIRVIHPFLSTAAFQGEGANSMETVVRINAASSLFAVVGAAMVVVGIALLAERQKPKPQQF